MAELPGWTLDTMLAHFSAQLVERDKAIVKVEAALEKRLDGMNEFRRSLSDQTASFVPRAEINQRFTVIEKTIDQIAGALSASAGRATGMHQGWGYIVGAIGLGLAIVGFLQR